MAEVKVVASERRIVVTATVAAEGEETKETKETFELLGGMAEGHASDIAAIAKRYKTETVTVVGGSDRLKAAIAAAGFEVLEPAQDASE